MATTTYQQWADDLRDGDLDEARRCWESGVQTERLLGSVRGAGVILVGDVVAGPNTLEAGRPLHGNLRDALARRFG